MTPGLCGFSVISPKAWMRERSSSCRTALCEEVIGGGGGGGRGGGVEVVASRATDRERRSRRLGIGVK